MGLLCRTPHALSFRARYLKWVHYNYKEQAIIVCSGRRLVRFNGKFAYVRSTHRNTVTQETTSSSVWEENRRLMWAEIFSQKRSIKSRQSSRQRYMPLMIEKLFSLPPRHSHLLELHLTLVSLWMMFSEKPKPLFQGTSGREDEDRVRLGSFVGEWYVMEDKN
jgi:hypothetical protein